MPAPSLSLHTNTHTHTHTLAHTMPEPMATAAMDISVGVLKRRPHHTASSAATTGMVASLEICTGGGVEA